MLRKLVTLAVLALPGACRDASYGQLPPPSDDVVIVWEGGGGWTTLTIRASGAAHYDFHPHGWGGDGETPRTSDGTLTREELASLVHTLAAHDACSLRGSSRQPVSEEHSNVLRLHLPGMKCTVEMLQNDWSGDGAAGACARALGVATERIAGTDASSPPDASRADVKTGASPRDAGTASPEECPARACGPRMAMPTRTCPDGVHSSGPTGRCIKKEGGACGWEVATCP